MKRQLLGGLILGSALALGASGLAWAQKPSGVRAVVDVQRGYLLGGFANGQWIKPAAAARSLRGGDAYRIYGATGAAGAATGTKPKSEGAPCEDTLFVTFKPARGDIATTSLANAMPRKPRPQSLSQPTYRAAVASLLKKNGIARPVVSLKQVWRVDLEGDGTDEVLVSATRHAGQPGSSISPDSRAGEYSLVVLRKVVGGKVKTIPLAQEYFPRAKTFNAPGLHALAAVLALNGDGVMEIVLRGRYYEGDWASVHEVKGGAARQVLSEGCGA